MPQRDSTIFPSSEICRLFQEPCFIGNKDFALILNIGQLSISTHYRVSNMALFMINGCQKGIFSFLTFVTESTGFTPLNGCKTKVTHSQEKQRVIYYLQQVRKAWGSFPQQFLPPPSAQYHEGQAVLKQSTYQKMTLNGVLTTSTFLGVQAQVTKSGSCDGGDGAQPGLWACQASTLPMECHSQLVFLFYK